MTQASLLSQPNRNSWGTVWAWMDGNYINGAFAYPEDRYDPNYALFARVGNPPVISPLLRLTIFAAIGLFFWVKTKNRDDQSFLSLIGITWVIFLLWSSGWSPQWVLYLIPIILLTFPTPKAIFLNLIMLLLALLEWPTLLGHQLFIFMGPLALLRSLLFIFLIYAWYPIISKCESPKLKPSQNGM